MRLGWLFRKAKWLYYALAWSWVAGVPMIYFGWDRSDYLLTGWGLVLLVISYRLFPGLIARKLQAQGDKLPKKIRYPIYLILCICFYLAWQNNGGSLLLIYGGMIGTIWSGGFLIMDLLGDVHRVVSERALERYGPRGRAVFRAFMIGPFVLLFSWHWYQSKYGLVNTEIVIEGSNGLRVEVESGPANAYWPPRFIRILGGSIEGNVKLKAYLYKGDERIASELLYYAEKEAENYHPWEVSFWGPSSAVLIDGQGGRHSIGNSTIGTYGIVQKDVEDFNEASSSGNVFKD